MAQLIERSLPTPEVQGSRPVIGKFYLSNYCQLYWKDENKEKEAGKLSLLKSRLQGSNLFLICRLQNAWLVFIICSTASYAKRALSYWSLVRIFRITLCPANLDQLRIRGWPRDCVRGRFEVAWWLEMGWCTTFLKQMKLKLLQKQRSWFTKCQWK